MSRSSRFLELDALRGIAAVSVMYFHYTYKYRQNFGHVIPEFYDFKYGSYGVELFFLLSGFVIYLTVEKMKSPFEFVYRRFTRLYPTYWWCLICTFVIVSIFGLPGFEVSLGEAIIGLTMIQALLKIPHVDQSYWSLLPELIFYGYMFLLLYFKRIKQINIFFSIWVFVMIINSFLKIPAINTLFNLRYGMLFFAGIIFYKLRKGERSTLNHFLILYCFTAACLVFRDLSGIIITLIFFGIFYLVAYNKLGFIARKPLIFLGNISYALYLLHQFIGYVIINILIDSGYNNVFLIIIIPVIFNILLAWFTTAVIEKNAMSFLRNKYTYIQGIFLKE